MRPRAALLLTTAVLLAACGSGPAAPTAADTPGAPSTLAAPSPASSPTSPSSPAPEPDSEPEPVASGPEAAAAAVTIADFAYAPESIAVPVGATVTWTNEDSTAHTATVSGGPDTGAIGSGASGSITFDAPGTYDYVCQFHPGSMAGSVVVGPA